MEAETILNIGQALSDANSFEHNARTGAAAVQLLISKIARQRMVQARGMHRPSELYGDSRRDRAKITAALKQDSIECLRAIACNMGLLLCSESGVICSGRYEAHLWPRGGCKYRRGKRHDCNTSA